MQIDRTSIQQIVNTYAGNTTVGGAQSKTIQQNGQQQSDVSAGDDQSGAVVTLSPQAQEYQQTLASAQNSPAVRMDRINAIRAKMQQPGYKVDVSTLATKLLQTSGNG